MEARRNETEPDVWAQLQQKESDILLAAELGKALLEKNEDLVKQQEKLIEDYSGKIEVSFKFKFNSSNYYHCFRTLSHAVYYYTVAALIALQIINGKRSLIVYR